MKILSTIVLLLTAGTLSAQPDAATCTGQTCTGQGSAIGFTTVSSGITIHRSDCPNARRLKQQYPYRVLEARWRSTAGRNSFLASVRIVAEDTTGMVNRITEVVSGELKINIRSMSLSPMRDGKIGGTINIEVPSTAVVDMVAANLMRIKGVEKAYRVTQQ